MTYTKQQFDAKLGFHFKNVTQLRSILTVRVCVLLGILDCINNKRFIFYF